MIGAASTDACDKHDGLVLAPLRPVDRVRNRRRRPASVENCFRRCPDDAERDAASTAPAEAPRSRPQRGNPTNCRCVTMNATTTRLNPGTVKFYKEGDKVLQAAAEPIDRPCRDKCERLELLSYSPKDHRELCATVIVYSWKFQPVRQQRSLFASPLRRFKPSHMLQICPEIWQHRARYADLGGLARATGHRPGEPPSPRR